MWLECYVVLDVDVDVDVDFGLGLFFSASSAPPREKGFA
jgi:hypothetical protein